MSLEWTISELSSSWRAFSGCIPFALLELEVASIIIHAPARCGVMVEEKPLQGRSIWCAVLRKCSGV